MKNPAYTKKHWFIFVAVALMMGSSLGLLTNGNGVFYLPMARSLEVPLGSISLHTTFKSFATAFTALTIPTIVDRFGIKKTIALGVAFGVIGTYFLSIAKSVPLIYFLGVIRGIGFAYYSLVPMQMILSRWFDKHNGLVMGLASGASGLFGAISAPLLTLAIEHFGWRNAFIIKSAFMLILVLPILLLPFTLNPEDEGLLPYGFEKDHEQAVLQKAEISDFQFTNQIFIALMLVSFLSTLVMYINSHFPVHGETVGLRPEIASLMLSGAMVGNVSWKAVYGALSDRIGVVQASLIMYAISLVSLVFMILSQNPAVLIFGSFLFGGIFAVNGVGLPLLSNTFFGPVVGAKVYSRVNFISSFGGALGVGLAGYIYDYSGSYILVFTIAISFILINIFLLLFAQRKHNKSL